MRAALSPRLRGAKEHKRAVFLDKDGTLIVDVPFNVNPSLIELSSDSIEGLRELSDVGFHLVIISNQSGLALGHFNEEELSRSLVVLDEMLLDQGIELSGIFYCPHHPSGTRPEWSALCGCRKPSDGLIREAGEVFNVSLSHSWMIGDILHDIEAGNRAGCRALLIDNGNETEWDLTPPYRLPFARVSSINDAAEMILSAEAKKQDE